MKTMMFLQSKEVFPGSEVIRKFACTNNLLWKKYALLAKINHMLTANSVMYRGKSAHFSENQDCFECLSPYEYIPI